MMRYRCLAAGLVQPRCHSSLHRHPLVRPLTSEGRSHGHGHTRNRRAVLALVLISSSVAGLYYLHQMTESPRAMMWQLKEAQATHSTILSAKHDAPAVPASAPQWLHELANDKGFDYKDVKAVFPVANHLIYDALQQDRGVEQFYHFLQSTAIGDSGSENPEVRVVFYIGNKLCGHRGIVHGGLTATLIDQVSGEAAFLTNGPGLFTANLNINYTAPCIAERYVLVKARVKSVEGRKTVIGVTVSDGGETEYANASVLFVRPKWIPANEKRADLIDASEVKHHHHHQQQQQR